jgi:ATP-dependent Clp protease ATP-binding subunit ClpC
MRLEVEEHLRNSPTNAAIYGSMPNQIFITPRVKRIIDFANEEANGLKDNTVASEHLFLAMCREKNTTLAHIFERRQLTRSGVYQAIRTLRDQQAAERPKENEEAWAEIANELVRTAVEHNVDPIVGRLLIQLITTMSRSHLQ